MPHVCHQHDQHVEDVHNQQHDGACIVHGTSSKQDSHDDDGQCIRAHVAHKGALCFERVLIGEQHRPTNDAADKGAAANLGPQCELVIAAADGCNGR